MEKKDRIKPVQPYLVIDTENYIQVKSSLFDISHFYSFSVESNAKVRLVPDGSVDMVFVYQDNKVRAFLVNAKLQYEEIEVQKSGTVFGVRFMPGILTKIKLKKKDSSVFTTEEFVVNTALDQQMIEDMSRTQKINEQIDIFCKWYEAVSDEQELDEEKRCIVGEIRKVIIGSSGRIRISELGKNVGYSERYINKLLSACLGYSPKTLCKVIQFQKALEYLDYGYPENMTEAAVSLGYYDQSQFIKVFSLYTNTTPKKYYELMEAHNFKDVMKTRIQ